MNFNFEREKLGISKLILIKQDLKLYDNRL